MPGAEVVALADTDATARQRAAALAPRARVFDSYRELLDQAETDAVVICAPSALHAEIATAAFDAGRHVYLEKPLGASLVEGRCVLDARARAGRLGMIGFNYRFNPLYERARRRLLAGEIGPAVAARTVFSTAAGAHLPDWKRERRTGGGALLDLASHHVDLGRYFFGQEVCEVFAALRSSEHGEGDTAALHLRLSGGALVQSFFSLSAVEEDRIDLYGRAGRLSVD
ncbi:MAG: Gfo/Idh/MocA family protein, partial [Pyrinomonadaceae bacterium]